LCTISLIAFAAPLVQSLPTKLVGRQERSRELIEPSMFPVLSRYTKYAVASAATFVFNLGTCPSPPFGSRLVKTINNRITDTQVAVFQDDTAKEFIVSFPGSTSIRDFVTDFVFFLTPLTTAPGCDGCEVHSGLFFAWRSVKNDLTAALEKLRNQHSDYSTIIVGHSLGGGLASLAYTDLKSNGVPVKSAYTMGALRTGNQEYADFTDRLAGASDDALGALIRITHNRDVVVNMPSRDLRFQHTGTEIYQVDNAAGTQTAETTYRCYGQEATDCSFGSADGFINLEHLEYSGVNMVNGDTCRS